MTKREIQTKALTNAINNESTANYQAIIEGFTQKGIAAADIIPRRNVFTFNAWKALGRVVRKGEKGVQVVTVIPCTKKDEQTGAETPVKKVKRTTVFHITQTDALDQEAVSESEGPAQEALPQVAVVTTEETAPQASRQVREISNNYEARQEGRRDRYEARAAAANQEGQRLYTRARDMASVIPFGQPILIGHHSEKRDRNYRDKIHNTFGKAFALHDKAKHYASKAAGVGTGGISSDDPDALRKLRDELAAVEAAQEKMKKANVCVRKNDRAGLVALGFSEKQIIELFTPDFAKRIGFADYALKNNNANARRIKQRIEQLEKVRSRDDREEAGSGYVYREDVNENRVMFEFDGKPEKAVIETLKRNAFKWSPTRGAWVRHLNEAGIWAAKQVRKALEAQAV